MADEGHPRTTPVTRFLRCSLIASPVTAAWALVGFGLVHALWIVPIWSRLGRGLPFALLSAVGLAWAYGELSRADRLPPPSVSAGAILGTGIWLALLPATLFASLARWSGVYASHGTWVDVVSVLLTAIVGWGWGRALGLRAAGQLACTSAVVGVLLAQAGPIAVAAGRHHAGLFVLLAPLYVTAAIVHAVCTDGVAKITEWSGQGR